MNIIIDDPKEMKDELKPYLEPSQPKVKPWDSLTDEEKQSGLWVKINRKQRKAMEANERRKNKHAHRG